MGQHGANWVDGACRGAAPTTGVSPSECHLALVRAGLLAEARVAEALRPVGLSAQAFNVLMVVGKAGEPLSPCVISERMVVPRNTLTHTLDLLERQELVRRERHPHHRGMVLVRLTDTGHATLGTILPHLDDLEAELWSHFSEDERETFNSLLARAQAALESTPSPAAVADSQPTETVTGPREIAAGSRPLVENT